MEKTISRICENCGTKFFVIPSRLKHGRGRHCSPKCQYEAIKKRPKPSQMTRKCIGCGNPFLVNKKHFIKEHKTRGVGKYCSRKCRDEHRIKENHPQYLNGVASEKRGPNWQSQKHKALKRDNYVCQSCGEYGNDVHHKIPFRKFGLENYKKANQLSNLITLCRPCHRKEDIRIQKEDRL